MSGFCTFTTADMFSCGLAWCRASLWLANVQVIVVEDENGNIVRETMKDTDTLARYKTMHETLVYLSHLDHDDTENQMLEKLRLQVLLLTLFVLFILLFASYRRPCTEACLHPAVVLHLSESYEASLYF